MNLQRFYRFRGLGLLVAAIILQAIGNLSLARGMRAVGDLGVTGGAGFDLWDWPALLLAGLANPYFWIGVLFLLGFFVLFALSLAELDLSYALPIVSVEIIANVLLASWVLDEVVTAQRWAGVGLVALGVALVAMSGKRISVAESIGVDSVGPKA